MNREEFLVSDLASSLSATGRWQINAQTIGEGDNERVRVSLTDFPFDAEGNASVTIRVTLSDLRNPDVLMNLQSAVSSIRERFYGTAMENSVDRCTKSLIEYGSYTMVSDRSEETGGFDAVVNINANRKFIARKSVDDIQRFSAYARDSIDSFYKEFSLYCTREAEKGVEEPENNSHKNHEEYSRDGVVDVWNNGEEESFLKEEYTLSAYHNVDGGNLNIFYSASVDSPMYGHEEIELGKWPNRPDRHMVEEKLAEALAEKDVDYLLANDLHHRVRIDKKIALDILHTGIHIDMFSNGSVIKDEAELLSGPDKVDVSFEDFADFISKYCEQRDNVKEKVWQKVQEEMAERNGQTELNKVCDFLDKHEIPYERSITDDIENVSVFNKDDDDSLWFDVSHEMGDEWLNVTAGLFFEDKDRIFDRDLRAFDVIERIEQLNHVVGTAELTNNMSLSIHMIEYGPDDTVLVSGNVGDKILVDPELIPLQVDDDGVFFFNWHGQEIRMDEIEAKEVYKLYVDDHEPENEKDSIWNSKKFRNAFNDAVEYSMSQDTADQERSGGSEHEGSEDNGVMKDDVNAAPKTEQKGEKVINMADEAKNVEQESKSKGAWAAEVNRRFRDGGMTPGQAYAATGNVIKNNTEKVNSSTEKNNSLYKNTLGEYIHEYLEENGLDSADQIPPEDMKKIQSKSFLRTGDIMKSHNNAGKDTKSEEISQKVSDPEH